MSYADFEIRILEKQDKRYPVEFTCEGKEYPRGFLEASQKPDLDSLMPSEVGEALFQWLFDDVGLKLAWAEASGRHLRRRIRLRIDADAPEIHQLPWESLRESGQGGVPRDLAATDATPFSRYISGKWERGEAVKQRPVRMLVVIANPSNLKSLGLPDIDADQEWKLLKESIGEEPAVEMVRLPEPVTLAAIEQELRNGYHILHFVGHGDFDKGTASLVLADETNKIKMVGDVEVAGMLGRQNLDQKGGVGSQLRLVFLSSCLTASRSEVYAFGGMAPKLVGSGVPAVVAMQDLVAVKTAHVFSRVFYRELLASGEVDRAANAGRSALMTVRAPGAAVPVLFMRLEDGRLFSPATVDEPEKPKPGMGKSWALLAGLILIASVGWFGRHWFAPKMEDPTQLSYWIEVQRFRDGAAFKDPFLLAKEVVFEEDYRIAVQVGATRLGYLYIWNEGPVEDGKPGFNGLYPAPGASAFVEGSGKVRIPARDWIVFDKAQGTESLFLIFSREPVQAIEELNQNPELVQHGHVLLRGERVEAMRKILAGLSKGEIKQRPDSAQTRTLVETIGGVLVHKVVLEHR